MRHLGDLAADLAELGRLSIAVREDPLDIETKIHLQEMRLRLPRRVLAIFDERRRRGLRVYAPLTSGVCGGCFAAQPLKRQMTLGEGHVPTCHACGALLVESSARSGTMLTSHGHAR